jgi:hypothetical protein
VPSYSLGYRDRSRVVQVVLKVLILVSWVISFAKEFQMLTPVFLMKVEAILVFVNGTRKRCAWRVG